MLIALLFSIAVPSAPSFANEAPTAGRTAAERACTPGIYCADTMVCVRTIAEPRPRGMHPDYYSSVVSLRTFKATRRNGSLVDSLQIADDPSGPTPPSLAQAWALAEFDWGNYGQPMRLRNNGSTVTLSWGPASNFSNGVVFEITSQEQRGDFRLDRLTGTERVEGDVVSNYTAHYVCEAKVVTALTRVDDFTSGRR